MDSEKLAWRSAFLDSGFLLLEKDRIALTPEPPQPKAAPPAAEEAPQAQSLQPQPEKKLRHYGTGQSRIVWVQADDQNEVLSTRYKTLISKILGRFGLEVEHIATINWNLSETAEPYEIYSTFAPQIVVLFGENVYLKGFSAIKLRKYAPKEEAGKWFLLVDPLESLITNRESAGRDTWQALKTLFQRAGLA